MAQNRLNHSADIFCEMLCGWRLANGYKEIIELGSGSYEMNILAESSAFNGKPVSLYMTAEIAAWFKKDIAINNVDINSVDSAQILADIEVKPLEGKRKTNTHFPQAEKSATYYSIKIKCQSEILAFGKKFKSAKEDYEEFPDKF